jgi:hypothetical protein
MWKLKPTKILLFNFSFLLSTLIFESCSKKEPCKNGPDGIFITLVDKNNNVLIGTVYSTDSVKFIRETEKQMVTIENGTITYLFYPWEDILNSNYYLYLTYKDTDTLKFKYYSFETECGTSYGCNGLIYNSNDISPAPYTNNVFKILKN